MTGFLRAPGILVADHVITTSPRAVDETPAPIAAVAKAPIVARVLDLARREFGETLALQRELVAARQRDEIPDTLLLVEHPDVITLGRGTHKENLVATGDVPIFEIERGGDVTYHGPGQLVGYPILQLRADERDLHRYLRDLEEALIRAVGDLGLPVGRRPAWTGVWTMAEPQAKLASIGVVLQATVMTSVSAALGRDVTLAKVAAPLVHHLGGIMNRSFAPG